MNAGPPNSAKGEYEVEKIVRKEFRRGAPFYLIKWSGYSKRQMTWEPECNLDNCRQLLSAFEARETQRQINPTPKVPIIPAGKSKSEQNKTCGKDARVEIARIVGVYADCGVFKYVVEVDDTGDSDESTVVETHFNVYTSSELAALNPRALIAYLESALRLDEAGAK